MMKITCWGSRGSIPVSGKEYLKYGGDTTCLEIRTKSDDIIIVDAGTGVRKLGNKLMEEERYEYHFIFTHAHWDHVMGFPFFKPIFSERAKLLAHKCPFHSQFVETVLTKIIAPPYFPVKFSEIKADISYKEACPSPFEIGSVSITPIHISNPNNGSGYKFVEDGKVFVFLTDNELGFVHPGGLAYEDYLEFCADADFLIHDAEYTPEEYKTHKAWGHTEYTRAIDLAGEAGVGKLGLFHINQERTDQEMDEIVEAAKQDLAEKGYGFECFAVGSEMTFEL